MRLVARLFPIVAATVATAAMALHAAAVWTLTPAARVAAIATLAVISLLEGVARIVSDALRERRLQDERRISETLNGALVQVVHASGLGWTAVGLNAFLVRRRYRLIGPPVLARVGRERVRISPPPSNVEWTLGKGVIGRCWQFGQDLGVDLQAHFAEVQHLSVSQWAELTDEDTLGLTYEEFQRTRQHAVVVATPILDRSEHVIGVVSADSPEGPLERLWNDDVRDALGAAAITIRNLLE